MHIITKSLRKTFSTPHELSMKTSHGDGANKKVDPRIEGKLFHAVRRVDISCYQGQVLGLLGPNGAGKTTTLRMLSTAFKPTAGEIIIDGVDVTQSPQTIRNKIGFLSGTTELYRRLTVRENIAYFAQLYGMKAREIDKVIDELAQQLNLGGFLHRRADQLSTGMKQRASIARAVVHDPEIIIFDEPTTGLDVVSAKTILDFIASYKEKGKPVIFSTHHLHEVERLCDKVAVIDEGESKFFGTLDAFKATTNTQSLYDAFLAAVDEE